MLGVLTSLSIAEYVHKNHKKIIRICSQYIPHVVIVNVGILILWLLDTLVCQRGYDIGHHFVLIVLIVIYRQ